MKRQMIKIIFLFTILIISLICRVEAHNVEIDPKSYIAMPSNIYNGEGTITISASVGNDYTLYYQKIDMTNSNYTQLQAKNKERQDYISTEKAKLTEEEAKVTALEKEYKTTKNDTNATQEQVKAAYDTYESAIDTYNIHIETYNTKINELNTAIMNLIPTYQENKWITATGTSNNVNLEFSNYSGQIHFALWAKLVTPAQTYYDVNCYSTDIMENTSISLNNTKVTIEIGKMFQLNATTNSNKTITWTSSKENVATVDANGNVKAIAEGITTITAAIDGKSANCVVSVIKANTENNEKEEEKDKQQEDSNKVDFSNAKFEYKAESLRNLKISIRDYKRKEDRLYYIFISKNKNENITTIPEEAALIGTNTEGIGEASLLADSANKILEQTGKNYIYIIEKDVKNNKQTVVLNAKEMPSMPLPQLGLRLDIWLYDPMKTLVSNKIAMNDDREITYKIGKISSNEILKSFKNDSSAVAYEKLLNYAKKANGIKTGTITTNGLEYNLVNKLNIEKDAYYFIYMVADNQNEKYINLEDVAIYEANNQKEGNAMVHFDFADIKIKEEQEKDPTIAPEKIPQAGEPYIVIIASIIIVVSVIIGYIKYKKYKDIK